MNAEIGNIKNILYYKMGETPHGDGKVSGDILWR
jgi:hypothetical protein